MPDERARWSIRFTPVPADGTPVIVEARFRDVVLQDDADVDEWTRRVDVDLARFGGGIDLLIDLSGLRVLPAASRRFGEMRARILAKHARQSVRYGADRWTATSVNTSRVLHGADANIYATREAALAALIEARRAL